MRKETDAEAIDLGPNRLELAGTAGRLRSALPEIRAELPERLRGRLDEVAGFLAHVQTLCQRDPNAPAAGE